MRFIVSFAEQGMGALITFGVNLWLIRNGRAVSYGDYVFWFSVAWVLATCQFTLTVVHLSSLPAGEDRLAERREPERVLLTVSLAFLAVASLGILGANVWLHARGSSLEEMAAVLFVPAFLLYQFVRAFAFSRRRVVLAAGLTFSVMVTAAIGLGLDYWTGTAPSAPRVLLIVGLAYGLCSLVALAAIDRRIRPTLRRADLRRYAHYMHGTGWLVLGAGSNEVTSRLYSFLVVGWFGQAALARLSAVQVVVRPAWMISAAWTSIGFPAMSTQRADGNMRGLLRTMIQGGAVAAVASAAWSGAVIAGWPWISRILYGGKYAQIGDLAWFWGGNVVLGSLAVALNTAMLSLGQFRRLAVIDLVGAVVCSASLLQLLSKFSYETSVIGTMIGQATQIALMAVAVGAQLRSLISWPKLA
jgi:O-antigen/teichoic acid export membrane protein